MKHLLIYAHPNPESFNHAILQTVIDTLNRLGASVQVRDLYKINFNPCLSMADLKAIDTGEVFPDVKIEQDFVNKADKITFIAPIWWGGFPAILKGYFDRVFTHNFAIAHMSTGVTGLLGEKKFGMINTMASTKEDALISGMNTAFNRIVDKGIFEFCDSPLCFHQIFYGVDAAGEEARKEMLQDVEKVIGQFVLDPNYCPFFG